MQEKCKIEFRMDNAAFDDAPASEAAAILRSIAACLENGRLEGTIQDINGNSIGSFKIGPQR